MLQTVEVEVDVNGSVRLLEPLNITKPTRALLTLLDSGPAEAEAGNVATLLEVLRLHRLPDEARLSVEDIDAQIEEARTAWE